MNEITEIKREKEICMGDKVVWIENDTEEILVLTPELFYYYTFTPQGFVKIKPLILS